ncbi:MAG: ABC transporter substrate-binding protein [Nocardioidaceae bacterium]
MRRRHLVVGLGALVLAVSACGNGAATSSSTSGSGSSSGAAAGQKYKVTLIVGTTNDNFYVTMNCGAKAEAAKLGVKYSYTGPSKFDASQQIPIVNSVTAKKPDAVLIAPTDSTALIAPMKAMKGQGVKIVEVDTTVKDNTIAASRIASNNELGGKDAADELAKEIGGKGTVMVVNVNPGISTTDARDKGFKEQMAAKHPNIKVLKTQYDNDQPSKAAQIVTSTYAAHPDLNGVFAANVLTAEGVATGIKEAHATGKIKNISFDAEPDDISALKKGVIDALIAQEPTLIGKDGVDQAVNALSGKPVTKVIQTKLVTITKDNLAHMRKYIYKSKC